MANPTSWSSYISGFIPFPITEAGSSLSQLAANAKQAFSEAQVDILDFEKTCQNKTFETLWSYADKFGFLGKSSVCILYPENCASKLALDIPSYAAYHIPKLAAEGTFFVLKTAASTVFQGPKKVFNIASTLAQSVLPVKDHIDNASAILETCYQSAARQANSLSLHSTSWITGKSVEQLAIDLAKEAAEDPISGLYSPPVFKAVDLIGPSLFLSYCTHQTIDHLSKAQDALGSAYENIRQLRLKRTDKAAIPIDDIIMNNSKVHTIWGDSFDTIVETALAGLWAAGTYATYNGIYNAVELASNSEQALLVVRGIAIAGYLVPKLLSWAASAPATPQTSPAIAPNLVYVDSGPDSADAIKRPPIKQKVKPQLEFESNTHLSMDQRAALVKKLRAKEN